MVTATPSAKDVVVVIDKSGSMGSYSASQTLMTIAKNAATSVVETLNPNDRVSINRFYLMNILQLSKTNNSKYDFL